jgi:hypothetical protein
VSGDPEFPRRIADALRAGRDNARPRGDCPPADDIWRAQRGETPLEERLKIIDHVAGCASCAEAWQLAMALPAEGAAAGLQPVVSSRWYRPTAVWSRAAAAILIVVAGTWLVRQWRDSATPGVRDQPASEIQSLLAENASLPRQDFVLRWSSGPAGARYDVVVTSTSLDVIVEARGLERADYRVAPERLAPLPAGSRLYWRVVASLPDGTTRSSATHVVVVQ